MCACACACVGGGGKRVCVRACVRVCAITAQCRTHIADTPGGVGSELLPSRFRVACRTTGGSARRRWSSAALIPICLIPDLFLVLKRAGVTLHTDRRNARVNRFRFDVDYSARSDRRPKGCDQQVLLWGHDGALESFALSGDDTAVRRSWTIIRLVL